jgi:hypothetical protein
MRVRTCAIATLLLPWLGGCSSSPAPAPGSAPAPAPTAAPVISPPTLAAGDQPTDLTALPHPLPGTIALPTGATVTSAEESNVTGDGFEYITPIATISGGGLPATITVSTGARLGWVPTTLDDDLASIARTGHAKVAATAQPDGNWFAAYKLTDTCYVHAWSPSAQLWCDADAPGHVGVPCEAVNAIAAVCLSITAAPATVTPRVNPGAAFEGVKDPKALAAAVAAGHAVATNDLAALTALIGPEPFRAGKRKLDAAGLGAAVAKAGSLSKLLGIDCAPAEPRAWTCRWNSQDDAADGKVLIYARSGYGLIPTIELARRHDGSWRVASFSTVDLGSP